MKKWSAEEVREFARSILSSYFCESDVELLISTFADDIIWLGGGKMQKAEGRDAVAAWFREGKDELSPCNMFGSVRASASLNQRKARESTSGYSRGLPLFSGKRGTDWKQSISITPYRSVN